MPATVVVLWILVGDDSVKASAEEQIRGRTTPEMLAVLSLYGLSSAHATVRTLNTMMNVVRAKN